MANEFRFLNLIGASSKPRRETLDGREHLVVPVVALVEGVVRAMNSKQPELVRGEKLRAAGWDGRPLYAGHPVDGTEPISGNDPRVLERSFGRTFNARCDGKRLLMEAWIDIEKAKSMPDSNRVLERCLAHERGDADAKPIEVSVGAMVHMKVAEGIFNGKPYFAEWDTIISDHLALLGEEKVGACSVAMGCGALRAAMLANAGGYIEIEGEEQLRAAMEHLEDPIPTEKKGRIARFMEIMRSLMPSGWGDDEVKMELRNELLKVEPGMRNGDIVRVKNDVVIYMMWPAYSSDDPTSWTPSYWQRAYSFDSDSQKFTISMDRTPVEPTTVYVPIKVAEGTVQDKQEPTPRAAEGCTCGNHAAPAAGEINMERKERIAALVANPHNPVKSMKMLEAATDDELKGLEDSAASVKTAAEKSTTDAAALAAKDVEIKAAQDALVEANKPKPITLEMLPAEMKSLVDESIARRTAEKDGLVAQLKVAQSAFTEEQLKAKPIDELKQLASLVKVPAAVDYSGQGVPRIAASGENYAPVDPWAASATK